MEIFDPTFFVEYGGNSVGDIASEEINLADDTDFRRSVSA